MLTALFSPYSQYLLRAPHSFLPRLCALFQLTSRGRKGHKDGLAYFVCYLNPFRHWVATAKYVISCDADTHKSSKTAANVATPKGDKQKAMVTPKSVKRALVTPKGAKPRTLFVPQGVAKIQDLSPVATPAPTSARTPAPR